MEKIFQRNIVAAGARGHNARACAGASVRDAGRADQVTDGLSASSRTAGAAVYAAQTLPNAQEGVKIDNLIVTGMHNCTYIQFGINAVVSNDFEGYYSQYAPQNFAALVWTNNAYVTATCLAGGAAPSPAPAPPAPPAPPAAPVPPVATLSNGAVLKYTGKVVWSYP